MHLTFLRKLRAERGIALPIVLGVMLVTSLLAAAAYAVANGDIGPSRADQDSKEAYAAAEAGVNYYAYHLGVDPNYWLKCDNVPAPDPNNPTEQPVNQPWTSGTDGRRWRTLSGSGAKFTIELLPASGYSACVQNNPDSMIDPSQGVLHIRVTGQSRNERRTILASFRRTKFLDYLYFTDEETQDPLTYSSSSLQSWAAQNCGTTSSPIYYPQRNRSCTQIQFASDDVLSGPLHTNDTIFTCNGTTLGRDSSDAIEVVGQAPGYVKVCGNTAPNIQGSYVNPAPRVQMPQTNATLNQTAQSAYRYSGTTTIVLLGNGNMKVTKSNGSTSTVAQPSNGVVYVSSTSCGVGYDYSQDYSSPSGCGDLWISGSTNQSITFATDNDIIVNGNITTTNGAEVGLIANNFVRVFHPVSWYTDRYGNTTCNGNTTSSKGTTPNEIDAAILSLTHSFIVDNWYCGNSLGTLTVKGAIAQFYRGPVGTTGGTGYIKNYVYDDRFRYSSPPYFLDPVQASWKMMKQTEQVPPH